MRYLSLFAIILLAFVLSACRQEGTRITTSLGDVPTPAIVPPAIAAVSAQRPDNVLSNASISGLSSSAIDVQPDGSVIIPASQLDPNGTAITVTKPGHWPERRLLFPAGDGELRETFVMEPKVKAGEISSAAGGTITISENLSVTLQPNTVVTTEDGTPYTGEVAVFVNHDAPEDADEMLNSALNFPARTADGSEAALESYGMMDIALEAPDGTPLVLGEDTPAEVRLPITSDTEKSAPGEVPFWILDASGFWLPAGTATLAPGCYVVYIVTSGTCNIDVPHPVTQICGRFVDPNGLPLTHSPFTVTLDGGMACSAARVDCDGEFCTTVAAGSPLLFTVTDPCTDETFAFAVDPVEENTSRDIGDIVVDLTSPVFVATVRDCSGSALPAVEKVEIWSGGNGGNDGQFFRPGADGSTVVNVVDCSGEDLLVQAFTDDYKAGSRLLRRTADDESLMSQFIVCGEPSGKEYFQLTVGDVEVPVTELVPIYWPDNGAYEWTVRVAGQVGEQTFALFLQFSDPRVGDYPNEEALAVVYQLLPGQIYGEGFVYVDPDQDINFRGVSLSEDGMTFEGAFDATMNLQNDVSKSVEETGIPVRATFRLEL